MSVSDTSLMPLPNEFADIELTDRELLEAIYASQIRTEMLVRETIENLRPTVEAFAKGGVMGLLGKLR